MSKPKYVRAESPAPDEYTAVAYPVTVRPGDGGDASFITGLLLGALTGGALVLLLSPAGRQQVQSLAQQLGVAAEAPGAAAHGDEVLTRVAPPPDPLSSHP